MAWNGQRIAQAKRLLRMSFVYLTLSIDGTNAHKTHTQRVEHARNTPSSSIFHLTDLQHSPLTIVVEANETEWCGPERRRRVRERESDRNAVYHRATNRCVQIARPFGRTKVHLSLFTVHDRYEPLFDPRIRPETTFRVSVLNTILGRCLRTRSTDWRAFNKCIYDTQKMFNLPVPLQRGANNERTNMPTQKHTYTHHTTCTTDTTCVLQ